MTNKNFFVIAFLLIAFHSNAEDFTLEKPQISDEKYQTNISSCIEDGFNRYTESLGFIGRIATSEEKQTRNKADIQRNCEHKELAVLRKDVREYEQAKREYEIRRAEEERLKRIEAEKAERTRLQKEEAEKRAAAEQAAAEGKRAKEEADRIYKEENAWKTYAYGGIAAAFFILWILISNSLTKKRNEHIRQQLEIDMADLNENLGVISRGKMPEFDNRDNINGYGAFIWSDYNCSIVGRKDVTRYKSVSASYSKTGDRKREGQTIKGRGRISVGGARGKYEKVDESVALGSHNIYVTAVGLYVCGDYPIVIDKHSLIAFRIHDDSTIQITYSGSKYPIEIKFPNWGRAKVCYSALQNI